MEQALPRSTKYFSAITRLQVICLSIALSDIVFPPSKLIKITLCRYGYIDTCLYDTREGAREWAEEIKDM
jgi:hypothetical protein